MKDKIFTMRTDPTFRANLLWLSNELGVPKSTAVEIAVNIYPEVVKMMIKHEELIKDLKDKL